MRRLLAGCWVVAGLLVGSAVAPPVASAGVTISARCGQSWRGDVDGFPVLLLRGTRAERGFAHGYLGAREIVSGVDSMAAFLGRMGKSWSTATTLATTVLGFPPEYEVELAAMLEGVRRALPDAADRQLPTVGHELGLADLKVLQSGELLELGCSQFSAWGALTPDGQLLLARNWDYPPLFPDAGRTIIAVDPFEKGTKATIDAMWFGMVGAGLALMNSDGVGVMSDDATISEGGFSVPHPQPMTTLIRSAFEHTTPATAVADLQAKLAQGSLSIIYQVFAPLSAGVQPQVLEYDVRAGGFGAQVRSADPAWNPSALVLTNHFLLSPVTPSASSARRYQALRDAIDAHAANGTTIGFAEAQAMLDGVAVTGLSMTRYSVVIWPALRRFRLAYAPTPSTPATQGTYVTVDWNEIFLAGTPFGSCNAPRGTAPVGTAVLLLGLPLALMVGARLARRGGRAGRS